MEKIKIKTFHEIEDKEKYNIIIFLNLLFRNKIKINFLSLLLLIAIFIIFIFINKKTNNFYYEKRLEYIKKNNRTYNELKLETIEDKLNWLAINDVNKLKGKCSDKILLHEYSQKILGKDICNKILKIYNNVNQINFNELPNQFVLKTNHGSEFNIIIENKANINIDEVKKKLKQWMKIDYGKLGAEFHYSFIKRKIFAEEFIGSNLKNYKFLCYNGKPKYVYVSITENEKKYRNFYDMNWNFLNYSCLSEPHPVYKFNKPKYFQLMKEYSIKLSKNFKFVRILK